MLRVVLIIGLIIGSLAVGRAHAGPWLRAKGDGFLSFSTELPLSGGDAFGAAYAEYGLSEKLTLGVDLGGSAQDIYKAVAFARVPLTRAEATLKLAFEIGVGLTADEAILRPGLSIGRGIALGDTSGWIAIDTLAQISAKNGDTNITTDITFGVNLSKHTKLIMQVQSGHHLMDPDYLKLAPSVVFERKPGQHVELGLLAGIENSEDLGLKLGVWRSF